MVYKLSIRVQIMVQLTLCVLIYLYSLNIYWFLLHPTSFFLCCLIIILIIILWATGPLLHGSIYANISKLMINCWYSIITHINFIQVVNVAIVQLESYLRWKPRVRIHLHLLLVYIRLVHHFHLGCNAVRRSPKWSRSIWSRQWTQWASIISLLSIFST